jgi:hypothetical protein
MASERPRRPSSPPPTIGVHMTALPRPRFGARVGTALSKDHPARDLPGPVGGRQACRQLISCGSCHRSYRAACRDRLGSTRPDSESHIVFSGHVAPARSQEQLAVTVTRHATCHVPRATCHVPRAATIHSGAVRRGDLTRWRRIRVGIRVGIDSAVSESVSESVLIVPCPNRYPSRY